MKSRNLNISILIPVFVGIITILALSVFGFINIRSITETTQEQMINNNRQLQSIYSSFSSLSSKLFNPMVEGDITNIADQLYKYNQDDQVFYAAARDTTSNIVTDARKPGWLPPSQEIKTLAEQAYSQQQLDQYEFQNALIIAGPIGSGSTCVGTLEIAYDLAPLRETERLTTLNLILSGLGIFMVLILVSIIFTRFATGQLQNVVVAAEELGRGNLDVEIPSIGVNEISIVGKSLDKTRIELKKLTGDYETQLNNLERRTQYLEATALVARYTTLLLDQQEMLTRFVNLIDEKFNFHQYGVYLFDDSGDCVELKAVSGEESIELSSKDIRYKVGQEGIIGHVASTGRFYISQDITTDKIFLSGKNIKDIHSEIALPLISRGVLIGVLDIQSKETNAFGNEEINVFQTLADQLTIAISNANLFLQTQENVLTLQQDYAEFNLETWRELLGDETQLGYYCDEEGIVSLSEFTASTETVGLSELDLPITVRGGQVIGSIKAHKPENSGEWDLDEISVMETLVDQLSTTLESAQLFQETQRRMGFEQTLRESSSRLRESLDVRTVIQTAAVEFRKALNLSEVEIRMGTTQDE